MGESQKRTRVACGMFLVGAVLAGSAVATTNPFFDVFGKLQAEAGLDQGCTVPRFSTSECGLVAANVICPDTNAACRKHGQLPDAFSSVCRVNFHFLHFLGCWGPHGGFSSLVEAGCVPRLADEVSRLQTAIQTANDTMVAVVSGASTDIADPLAYRDCRSEADTPEESTDFFKSTELAAQLLKTALLLTGGIAQNATLPAPPAHVPGNVFTDIRFECSSPSHVLKWRHNTALVGTTAPGTSDDAYSELTECASVARDEFADHVVSDPANPDAIGCFRDAATGDIVPFFRPSSTSSGSVCRENTTVQGFACLPGTVLEGSASAAPGPSFEFFTGTYTAIQNQTIDLSDIVVFLCRIPSFPRGDVVERVCSTTYVKAESVAANGPVSRVRTANHLLSRAACEDQCTLVGPICAGYAWDSGSPFLCVLNLDNDVGVTTESISRLATRLQVKVYHSDDGVKPVVESLFEPFLHYEKRIVRSENASASFRGGPWLVYGHAVQNDLRDQTAMTTGMPQKTPEACGRQCSILENCVFSVWVDQSQPCRHYILEPDTPFPGDFLFDGPPRCRALEHNRYSAALVGTAGTPDTVVNNTIEAVCGRAPLCSFTRRGTFDPPASASPTAPLETADMCLPFSVSDSALFVNPPASLPVVYAVPEPAARLLSTPFIESSWCPNARVCADCAGACADTDTVLVPATVSEFNASNFANCPALRVAIVMTRAPHFRDGAFENCPVLERVLLENHECLLSPTPTGCTAFFEPGAVPTCVGPDSEKFGYSTAARPADPDVCNTCHACASTGPPFFAKPDASLSSMEEGAFSKCARLHDYSFAGSSVTTVGVSAFFEASSLTTLDLGSTVVHIGSSAFQHTAKLETIIGGNATQTIGASAFSGSAFSGIFPLSNSLTAMGPSAFYDAQVDTFHTGDALTTVPKSAFENSGIRVVSLGASVAHVGVDAFRSCSVLATVEITSTHLTMISAGAFFNCVHLAVFNVPAMTVTSLGSAAFLDTARLTTFAIGITPSPQDMALAFGRRSGCTTSRDFQFELAKRYVACVATDPVKVACSVTAFDGPTPCHGKRDITISATAIPPNAFAFQSTLNAVAFEHTVDVVGESAFSAVDIGPHGIHFVPSQIETLLFAPGGGNHLSIESSAFFYVQTLRRLDFSGLGRSVSVKNSAFSSSGLTTAVLDNVVYIGVEAFEFCSSLAEVYFANTLTFIGASAFSGCGSLVTISIPGTVQTIGTDAFSQCYMLSAVRFASRGTSLFSSFGPFVFDQDPAIISVIFDDTPPLVDENNVNIYPTDIFAVRSASPYGYCALSDGTFCDNANAGDSQFVCFGLSRTSSQDTACPVFRTSADASASVHPSPAHVADQQHAAHAAASGRNYALSSLECVPCEPSDTAAEAHRAGRAVVPAGVLHVSANPLSECPGVTAVTVPAATTFVSNVGRSAFASPVLKRITFSPPLAADALPTHHSYTARCLMNVNAWFSGASPLPVESTPAGAAAAHKKYGSLEAFAGAPVVPNGVECVPCVTDTSVGDLTVPWYVRHIPPYAFSDCSIPGTLRFDYHSAANGIPGGGVMQIGPHAFHMEDGKSLGAVAVPPTLQDESNTGGPLFGGLGVKAFSAIGFKAYVVAVPHAFRVQHDATNGFPNQDRNWWADRLDVRTGAASADSCYAHTGYHSRIAPEAAPSTGTVTASGCLRPRNITAELAKPPRRLSRLFGVCDCVEMRPGCFPDEEYNPVATLPDARAAECGPEARRIGPVTIPYYPLLLPPGVVPLTINQSASAYDPTESENCTLEFSVRVPPGAHRPGCNICDASQCVPAAMDSVAAADFVPPVAAPVAAPAPTPAPPPPEAPPPPDTNTATVVAIVIVSVLGGTWAVWYAVQAWRRWKAGAGKDGKNNFK